MKTFISFTVIVFLFCSCSSNPIDSVDAIDTDFSIVLTKDIENNSPEQVALDKLVLEDEAFLSIQSIQSYEWANHMIHFSNETKEKLKSKEPLFGRHFVVIAQSQPIYWGLFTDVVSSGSCQNPVICLMPRHPAMKSFIPVAFVIQRAYPGYMGDENDRDYRSDLRIYNALKEKGKLK